MLAIVQRVGFTILLWVFLVSPNFAFQQKLDHNIPQLSEEWWTIKQIDLNLASAEESKTQKRAVLGNIGHFFGRPFESMGFTAPPTGKKAIKSCSVEVVSSTGIIHSESYTDNLHITSCILARPKDPVRVIVSNNKGSLSYAIDFEH